MRFSRGFKELVSALPEAEAFLLWSQADGRKIYEGHMEKYRVADFIQKRVNEKVSPIVVKANQQGESVRYTWVTCGKPACGICGGKRPFHFHVERKDGDLPLEQWLRTYVSPEEIIGIVALIRCFEAIRILLTYERKVLENLGLVERG